MKMHPRYEGFVEFVVVDDYAKEVSNPLTVRSIRNTLLSLVYLCSDRCLMVNG